MKSFIISLSAAILPLAAASLLAAASFAMSPQGGSGSATATPRLCYRIFSPVCTDCPKSTNDYCWPQKDGPFKSCKTLDAEQTCADGFCGRVDPGPTGCNNPYAVGGASSSGQ